VAGDGVQIHHPMSGGQGNVRAASGRTVVTAATMPVHSRTTPLRVTEVVARRGGGAGHEPQARKQCCDRGKRREPDTTHAYLDRFAAGSRRIRRHSPKQAF
jgi:hypothetical protein